MRIAKRAMSSSLIFVLHLGSTLYMVGLIWFVQLVHYPLHAWVGTQTFAQYQQNHMQWTSLAVGPAMLIEAATTLFLFLNPTQNLPSWSFLLGMVLLAIVWLSTALLQVPAHNQLLQSFHPTAHSTLVWSNWIRTVAWTARGVLVLWLTLQRIK